jgi:hypothetical protein
MWYDNKKITMEEIKRIGKNYMILSILLMFAGLILIFLDLRIGLICLFLAAFFDGELSRYKIYYQLKLSKRL